MAAVVATAGITVGVVKSGDDTASAAAAGPGGQGMTGGFGGRGGGGGSAANALHGTYVVPDGNGGYTTQESQTGTVSAVSSDSITVKSEDGYSKTYVVTSTTSVDDGQGAVSDLASGDTVRIVGTTSGDTSTATTITDSSAANQQGGTQQGGQAGQQGGGFGQGGAPGGLPQGGTQQGGPQQDGTTGT